jgi:hypothetical protein
MWERSVGNRAQIRNAVPLGQASYVWPDPGSDRSQAVLMEMTVMRHRVAPYDG